MGDCPAGTRCGTHTGASRWGGSKAGCEPCRTAKRRYDKHQSYRLATRGPAYVDATPARNHLHQLLASSRVGRAPKAGSWWFLPAAKTLGLGATQLRRIAAGDIQRIWPSTLDKILSLSPDDHDVHGKVRDHATWDVLVAVLHDKGWTRAGIARALGAATNNLQIGRGAKVRKDNLDALRALMVHDRPPAAYVRPPRGGWDAWWNLRPDHGDARHHTRRGCRRRGCRRGECLDAMRLYEAAGRLDDARLAVLVAETEERHRLRTAATQRTQIARQTLRTAA